MERTISPIKRLSAITLAFAMFLGLSAVGSVATAGDPANGTVRVTKVDENGAQLSGARLNVLNAQGTVVEQWTTTGTTMELSLPAGDYQLVEVEAPQGYDKASPIGFTVEQPTVHQETRVIAPASGVPGTQVVALGSGGDDRGRNGGYTVEATSSTDWNYTRDYKYGPKYPVFCLDALKGNVEAGALSYELTDDSINGLTRDQFLRILYVGSIGDAKGYGAQIQSGQGLGMDQASQFWLATAYAVNSYTNGQDVAWEHRGQYLTPANFEIAKQMVADAMDESIAIPEGTLAYLYQRPGGDYQPVASAAFPKVEVIEIYRSNPVEITMVNQKAAAKTGKAVIKKVSSDGRDLAGAQLQILDANGAIVAEFTTTGAPMEFELAPGDYILHEAAAPAGYQPAADIPFSVKEIKTETHTSTFPSGNAIVRGDGDSVGGLQFVVTENGDHPAYCIEIWNPNPLASGHEYAEADLASFDSEYGLYRGQELLQALRRVLYAGYGSDAFGRVEASGLSDFLKQDATRFAVHALADYYYNLRGIQVGPAYENGFISSSGGQPEKDLTRDLVNIGKDTSIQVPDEFKVKVFRPVAGNTQAVITGYWEATSSATEIVPAEVTMVDQRDIAIGTTATDSETEDHISYADGEVTINDVVAYDGLVPGTEYTLAGTLVKKSDGSAIATAEKTFVATAEKGEETVTFTFDGSGLAGESTVVFEELLCNGSVVAEHKNPFDEGQTIDFPSAKTNATDKADGDHSALNEKITIVDEVTYTNLIPGKEYTVSGTLMKKSDGKPLDAEGATASVTFVAEQKNGSVKLEFTIDATALIGEKLVAFEKVTYKDDVVAVHEDINDEDQTVTIEEKPSIGTTATDGATGDHIGQATANTVLKDVVTYTGLKGGQTYTVKGQLMKRADSSVIEGATAEATFVADASGKGSVELTFTYDATKLAGFASVAFEELYDVEGKLVAEHKEIKDEGQTVYYPEIRTTATDPADGDKVVKPAKNTTVVDTVAYTNLVPGKEYTVTGTLMKKSDGQPLVIDGKPVTATKTFTAEKKNGTVDLEFTFDASKLASTTLVAFEKVSLGDDVVAVHEDLTDADQTVVVSKKPQIGTTAADKLDGDKTIEAAPGQKVVDTVAYANLDKGREYTLVGTLMDKTTGAPVMNGNDKIVASVTFTATDAKGTVDVEFNFDATGLEGRELVVFEKLFEGPSASGEQVAKHENINDAAQTVSVAEEEGVPEIGTTATDAATGEHIGLAAEKATVVDVVAYTGLKGGKEYTIKGQLMKKADGSKIAGATAEATFVAAESGEGTVELTFTFDATQIAGSKAVAFEYLYDGEAEIASHADINDEAQTVAYPDLKTNASDKEDGDQAADPATVTIVDKVTYRGLIVGKEYTVSGTLMKKSDGQPLDVPGATATKTFTATKANGYVTLEFTIDASALAGEKIVAFEKVSYKDDVVAVHEDINDEDQTVVIEEKPSIGTTATDNKDGDKAVEIGAKAEVKDVVAYTNLKPGKEYTLSGKLVTKSSKGKKVVAEASTTFTPAARDGEVELVFTVDTTSLKGDKLVAFETVSLDGVEVAVHADIKDADQTVTVDEQPEIEKYVNRNVHKSIDLDEVFTYDVLAYVTKDADKVTVTDELVSDLQFVSAASDVKVADLGTDNNHMPNGTVAEEGTAIAADATIEGQKLTVVIDPAKAVRGHWVKVTFDAKIKDGLTIADLKYAKITENDPVITDEIHEGVPNKASYAIEVGNEGKYSDESNTVTVNPKEPKIATTATDAADGDKLVPVSKKAQVKDVVEYEGLKANTKYTMSGRLMNKATGKAVASATAEFTTDATGAGTVELVFTVNTTKIQGADLVAFEKAIEFDTEKVIATHEDIEDENQTVTVDRKPEIGTVATDAETDDHIAPAAEGRTIVDVVAYANLVPGAEYTLKGELKRKSDGATIATAESVFTASATGAGVATVIFENVDLAAMGGDAAVAFEEAYDAEGALVAEHKDINDAAQTVVVPEARTNATDATDGDHYVAPDAQVTIIDEVTYTNLIPGKEYTVTGTLHVQKADGTDGGPLDAEGATASVTFVPESANGSVELAFTIDASALAGEKVVAFEQVSYNGVVVAVHEDITDVAQTVEVRNPEIGTVAQYAEGDPKLIDLAEAPEQIELVDTVTYTGFEPGKEYTLRGTLMNKATSQPVWIDGNEANGPVTGETTFMAEKEDGTIDVTFTFSKTTLQAISLIDPEVGTGTASAVVFEQLFEGDKQIAEHEDITDENQTVGTKQTTKDELVPMLGTTATDAKDADKTIAPDGTATVNDAVDYFGFEAGKTYTVKGMLVKKSDGSVVATGETTFVAQAANGTEIVVFTFDAAALENEELVAFEYAFEGDGAGVAVETVEQAHEAELTDQFVAKHEDINDYAQTVGVGKKPEPSSSATPTAPVPTPASTTPASKSGTTVKPSTTSVRPVTSTTKTTTRLPVTGLSKTGAATGVALGLMFVLTGAGGVLIRRRRNQE